MDLPTYTSIWRIEKRLYKLYDFRLPMPLPIGQVTVFAAVAVPYVVILQLLGLPFNHTLIWLYILPPGLVTWLATRPVLESKRLPELIRSQLRYLAEPKVICRMAPLAERDVVVVTGRVWRPRARRGQSALASAPTADALAADVLACDVLVGSELAPDALDEDGAGATALGDAALNGVLPGDAIPRVEASSAGRRPLPPGRARTLARAMDPGCAGPDAPGQVPAEAAEAEEVAWAAAPVMEEEVASPRDAESVRDTEPPCPQEPARPQDPVRRDEPAGDAAAARRPAWPISSWSSAPDVLASARRPEDRAGTGSESGTETRSGSAPPASPVLADASGTPEVQAVAPEVPAGLAVPARPVPAAAQDPDAPGSRAVAAGPVAPAASAGEPGPAPASPGQSPEPVAGEGPPSGAAEGARPAEPSGRPQVTVVTAGGARTAPPAVERALAGPSARRGDLRAGRVAVVPGGHRPGKPDLLQRDRSRAQQAIGGPARVVVLGCTVGAGQTMTTLLTGDVLASLRSDRIAVLDLNPGSGSLVTRAGARPALGQAALLSPSRLAVIAPPRPGAHGPFGGAQNGSRADAQLAFEAATDRYELVLADPATVAVPRLLGLADQLVLVAPASGAAPGAVAMTFEWLEAHGQADLAAGAIMVLNGVSRRSIAHIEQAERVCAGRCRATVRVPWDDQLQQRAPQRMPAGGGGPEARPHWAGVLSPATAAAFTALAGVLVASLADRADGADRAEPPHPPGLVPARAGAEQRQEPAELGQGHR